jgi:hypothetical protein
MATTLPAASARSTPAAAAPLSTSTAVTTVRRALVIAASLTQVGIIWDIAWHRSVGRDTFWTAPHMVEYAAAIIVGLACGWLVLRTTFAERNTDRSAMVGFWGFRGPMGAWVCIWGTFAMLASAPFDDWWHNAYGLDVKIVSPPHMVLAAGMFAIVAGALLMTLTEQNLSGQSRATESRAAKWGYAFTAGLMLLSFATASFEYTGFPNLWHGNAFYGVAAGLFPFALAFVARTGKLRWPATASAGIFMLVSLTLSWVLQLVPATPKLAPIENPITHLVPAPFPILLIVPAFAFDLIYQRWRDRGDWRLAAMLGVAFVAVFAAASWPAAEFLLSPMARNRVFLADQWDYSARLGAWRYQYWDLLRPFRSRGGVRGGATPVGLGFLTAALIGTVSARLGLALGSWMREVRR